jgi:hypothetical protein
MTAADENRRRGSHAIWIPNELHERLRVTAEERLVSQTILTRRLLEEALDRLLPAGDFLFKPKP